MPAFIPGLELSNKFFKTEVQPLLTEYFPKLRYSAALIGWGSEVLGFDTARSRDHHWGPRVLLFLSNSDYAKLQRRVSQILSKRLPYEFMGYSTNFSQPEANGVRHPVRISSGPVNHMINIYTPRSFFRARLGIDPMRKIKVADWLVMPQQRLLEVVSGDVFYDGLNQLDRIRAKLDFYPRDVWLYLLAAQWKRISQEEAFVGRAGEVGDELGSQIVAARLVREIVRLTLLMERQYAPYNKWLGSAFRTLRISKKLGPVLRKVLLAKSWRVRQLALGEAYEIIVRRHNALKITKPLPAKVSMYFNRPFLVIHGEYFTTEIRRAIKDPQVKRITTDVGSVDQLTDSNDLTIEMAKHLRIAYKN